MLEQARYARTGGSIMIYLGTDFFEIDDNEENRERFIPLVESNDVETLREYLDDDSDSYLVLEADDRFRKDPATGRVYYGETERPVPRSLAHRIKSSLENDYPVEAEVNFWKNCLLNPDPNSVDQLWEFTQRHSVPVTKQGLLLCYKKVGVKKYHDTETGKQIGYANKDHDIYTDENGNPVGRQYDALSGKMQELALSDELMFVDLYTGEVDNSVGQIVSMDRDEVLEDPDQACGPGLHAAAMEYIPHYGTGGNISPPENKSSWEDCSIEETHNYLRQYSGDPIVEVLVNPRHVVSVPKDHSFAKLRACQYFVYRLFNGERTEDYVPQDYIDADSERLREELDSNVEEAKKEVEKAERKKQLADHLQ